MHACIRFPRDTAIVPTATGLLHTSPARVSPGIDPQESSPAGRSCRLVHQGKGENGKAHHVLDQRQSRPFCVPYGPGRQA